MDNKYIIAIDSGHGIDTKGKQSPDGSFKEWEFNKDIERRLVTLLQKENINYLLIHPEDTDTPLSKRCTTIKKFLSVNDKNVLVGISIHADAFDKEEANGFTTFYRAAPKDKRSLASYRLASLLEVFLNISYQKNDIKIKSRGVKASPTLNQVPSYFVLREYPGTWTLVEAGFMTNKNDCTYLKDDHFRRIFAETLFEGIKQYCKI